MNTSVNGAAVVAAGAVMSSWVPTNVYPEPAGGAAGGSTSVIVIGPGSGLVTVTVTGWSLVAGPAGRIFRARSRVNAGRGT